MINIQKLLKSDIRYESRYLLASYWLELTNNDLEETANTITKLRRFKEYFEPNIEQLIKKGFNPETIETTLNSIQQKLLTLKYNKISDFPNFEFSNRTINYWIFRGWTNDEAIIKVSEYQKANAKKRSDQISFLKEHNPSKLREQMSTTIEYYTSRGLSLNDAEIARQNRQATFSKKKMIEKYGDEKGLSIVEKRNQKWMNTLHQNNNWELLSKSKAMSKDKMIRKYGNELGSQKWDEFIASCNGRYSQNWFDTKYGTEEGYERYISYKEKMQGRWTLDWCITKFGMENGLTKYESHREKVSCPLGRASKESLSIFIPLFKHLRRLGIKREDIFFGISGSKEWFCRTDTDFFMYDFTIKSLKLIIEYHGITFHPKPGELCWVSPFGVKYEEMYAKDCRKKYVAEQSGFRVIEVWSDDVDILRTLINIINEEINKCVK